MVSGAIIEDGDRKPAPFLIWGLSLHYDDGWTILKLRVRKRASVHATSTFADVAQDKRRPKFPKMFMLLAHNSIRLYLLRFCYIRRKVLQFE